MNKRAQKLRARIERDTSHLDDLLSDLKERSGKETFQEALKLFERGWRLQNWGAFLTDTDEEIQLSGPDGQSDYWADGAGRNTDEAFAIIGVENTERGEDILGYLSDLTMEE